MKVVKGWITYVDSDAAWHFYKKLPLIMTSSGDLKIHRAELRYEVKEKKKQKA
jgi:hypothetical protein